MSADNFQPPDLEPPEDGICEGCQHAMYLTPGYDPTPYCNQCAQDMVKEALRYRYLRAHWFDLAPDSRSARAKVINAADVESLDAFIDAALLESVAGKPE